jgi:hypothetical protein
MSVPIPNLTPTGAAACTACTREAFFQVRIESPAGRGHALRRVNACASHLVDAIQAQRAWAETRQLTRCWLTVLAIDPYALPRLAARGVADHGFAFYSIPVHAGGSLDRWTAQAKA